MRNGPPSAGYPETDGPPKTVAQITELCDRLAGLPQPFGESPIDFTEGIIRMTNSAVELLAGEESEHLPPRGAKHDLIEAGALDALLDYCRAEAGG